MAEWVEIEEFPGYSVSDEGQVANDHTGTVLSISTNQQGIPYVGLVSSEDGVQYKRSVALLVANGFLPPPVPPHFDTPINLDGNRLNNCVWNLMWRPRWFAIKYHKQFHNSERGFIVPIEDVQTGERFKTSWQAAVKYGLLDKEIKIATINHTYVFPTGQRFRTLK